jgi:16S rRNA G966 N2-methylase RsmD
MEDLNYALVEDVRPPIYTAMKYWGKKPHNIWRKYIENYTSENGLYLDPFAGSAISVFEAVKANKKAIAFDLNPLTSFIIEVMSAPFDKTKFNAEVNKILSKIKNDEVYKKYFFTQSRKNNDLEEVVCFKWDSGQLYELGIEENEKPNSKKKPDRYLSKPDKTDIEKGGSMADIEIPFWYPNVLFPQSPSFSANFLQCIGGNNFSNLWTRRNLYVLSKIFDEILKEPDDNLKKQLLFGFIQTLHLCTKMSVPRRKAANRDYSTSWGRSAYICAARKMEMNALMVFKGSCFGKQSVESCLSSVVGYLGKLPKITNVSYSNKQKNKLSGFDIKYGTIDVNTILDYISENSIDFIMTDPPYGGLAQYLDLSLIWLNWLKHYNAKYEPNLEAEITVKKGIIGIDIYKQRFTNALKNLYKLLKEDGKIVFTFHNKELLIWNAFLKSITLAGFKIEKVIHQQNRRTGEANVANPYGTSGTDFYIRCIKSTTTDIKTDKDEFEHFVLTKAIEIIAIRNEPTPYQFLFNGILAEISSAGFDLEDFDSNIQRILEKRVGKIFTIKTNGDNKAGNYWWFANPANQIKYPDKLLTDRVEDSIVALLRRKTAVSLDDVLGDIFQRYPNGLTPDIKSIDKILKKYATQSNGKWLYRRSELETEYTKHTEMLYYLSEIGHKTGYQVFVGKREQSENYNGKKLYEFADLHDLGFLPLEKDKIDRVAMIDMLWLKDNKIEYIIEVENTTKFTSGIQRASNVEIEIPKLMVIPDKRKDEFLRINDPLFTDNFKNYNWKYIYYSEIENIKSSRKIDLQLIDTFAKEL